MVPWSAFPGVCFSSLSDVHECYHGLQMALVGLDKHLPSWKSPNNWLVRLAIKLATFVIPRAQRPQMRQSSFVQLVQIEKPAT